VNCFGARLNIALVSGHLQKIAQFPDVILRFRNNFMAADIQNLVSIFPPSAAFEQFVLDESSA